MGGKIELKACPFCGGDARKIETDTGWRVECANDVSCNVEATVWLPDEECAVSAWNTRALSTPPDPVREGELREKVARIIDPNGWRQYDAQIECIGRLVTNRQDEQRQEALFYVRQAIKQADAILALLPASKPLQQATLAMKQAGMRVLARFGVHGTDVAGMVWAAMIAASQGEK